MNLWTLKGGAHAPLCSDCAFPVIQECVKPFLGLGVPYLDHEPTSAEDGIEMIRNLAAFELKPSIFVELHAGKCEQCGRSLRSCISL